MSHHRNHQPAITGTPSTTAPAAHWTCSRCRLDAMPLHGPSAAAETALLAGIHDRVHHGGARTAELLLTDGLPILYSAAS